MCMIDGCEPCTWLGTEKRRARKTHRCQECSRVIGAGEIYHYSRFVSDGRLEDNKACEHCHTARGWLSKHCGSWVTGYLREDLEEHLDNDYGDGLERLVVGIRRRWKGFGSAPLMRVPAPIGGTTSATKKGI